MKISIALLVVVLCLTACSWFIQPEGETEMMGEVDSIVTISGEVSGTVTDCIFDGICAFVIATENNGEVTVIWSEGMSPNCGNNMFGDITNDDIQIGDTIEAQGRVTSADAITTCGDESFYIRKTS